MKSHTRTYIAYIAGRLITGKRIATLYDFSQLQHINITSLPDAESLREFDRLYRDYIPGYASGCTYKYTSSTGHSIDLSFNGNTFIGHISGSSAYFVGNVRGDNIYVFDHEDSAHLNYKISGCIVEYEDSSTLCNKCWFLK
jgi:hypothetical protein